MARRIRKNSRRPAVGVTGNSKKLSPSWLCIRLSLWLCGARAVRIRVGDDVDLETLAGMVISGGDDIHPALYGEEPAAGGRYDRERDRMESRCIDFALRTGLPLLGICRGHQLINTVMGGNLHISVRSMRAKTSNRWSLLPRKRVTIEEKCRLAGIVGKRHIPVNSLHNQAIAEVAGGMSAVAFDEDLIVQAIEAADDRAILGVQWHPEYLCFLPVQMRLFRWLVDEAGNRVNRDP